MNKNSKELNEKKRSEREKIQIIKFIITGREKVRKIERGIDREIKKER